MGSVLKKIKRNQEDNQFYTLLKEDYKWTRRGTVRRRLMAFNAAVADAVCEGLRTLQ